MKPRSLALAISFGFLFLTAITAYSVPTAKATGITCDNWDDRWHNEWHDYVHSNWHDFFHIEVHDYLHSVLPDWELDSSHDDFHNELHAYWHLNWHDLYHNELHGYWHKFWEDKCSQVVQVPEFDAPALVIAALALPLVLMIARRSPALKAPKTN